HTHTHAHTHTRTHTHTHTHPPSPLLHIPLVFGIRRLDLGRTDEMLPNSSLRYHPRQPTHTHTHTHTHTPPISPPPHSTGLWDKASGFGAHGRDAPKFFSITVATCG